MSPKRMASSRRETSRSSPILPLSAAYRSRGPVMAILGGRQSLLGSTTDRYGHPKLLWACGTAKPDQGPDAPHDAFPFLGRRFFPRFFKELKFAIHKARVPGGKSRDVHFVGSYWGLAKAVDARFVLASADKYTFCNIKTRDASFCPTPMTLSCPSGTRGFPPTPETQSSMEISGPLCGGKLRMLQFGPTRRIATGTGGAKKKTWP